MTIEKINIENKEWKEQQKDIFSNPEKQFLQLKNEECQAQSRNIPLRKEKMGTLHCLYEFNNKKLTKTQLNIIQIPFK